jgi:Ring finger domain
LDEPARLINPGEKPWIMNPRFRNATDIAILAVEWRWRVEEYERDTRGSQSLLERDKRERVHEMRRKQRRLRRDADWATYQNCLIPVGRILPQILNLTQETQDYRALQVALPSPGALCSIFPGGIDMPADGERDANARAMLCGHVMHRKCLAQALMHTRACPDCKNSVNFVLKSSFDDPKHRWDEEKKKGIQVNGYVDFKAGLEGRNFLEPYGKDNRWGDDA